MRVIMLSVATLVLAMGCSPAPTTPAEPAAPPAPAAEIAPEAGPDAAPEEESPSVDAETLPLNTLAARLVGRWRSTTDERSTVTITADGVWVDDYTDPPIHETSAWRVFAGSDAATSPGGTTVFTPTSTYLEVKSKDLTLYYEMGKIADDGFDMFYTARGNLLAFTRVPS